MCNQLVLALIITWHFGNEQRAAVYTLDDRQLCGHRWCISGCAHSAARNALAIDGQWTLMPVQLTTLVVHVAGWILVLLGAFGAAATPTTDQSAVDARQPEHLVGEQIEAIDS